MPSFLRQLRRNRSKTSLKPSNPDGNVQTTTSSGNTSSDGASDERPRLNLTKSSSSTLGSFLDTQSPSTTVSSLKSRSNVHLPNGNGNGAKTPPALHEGSISNMSRPRLASSGTSKRYSLAGSLTLDGEITPRFVTSSSPFAPRIASVSDNSWVNQKVLLVYGTCADVNRPIDGKVTVNHHEDQFPATEWPVSDCHFKALVHLQPGWNRLQFDFTSAKLSSPDGKLQVHSSYIRINYLPLISAPPLQLAILVAKDSPETYDAVPDRVQKEGNGLETAIRKFRTAAYLWQAFTAEHMYRNGFGRRCYRYEEEWQVGTLSWKDMEQGKMRNEIKIHVVRVDKTVQELRDLNLAQQYSEAKDNGGLHRLAEESVRAHFGTRPGQTQYVSCMYLDTHWDKEKGVIRGHAALGSGGGDVRIGIFGSHALQSYPAHIEEVVPAFTDCTRTDTDYVANDLNESGSNWEAANIGIGAHLHETGHVFGCPHQESGVMARDYVTLNRTFTTRERYSTRTRQQGLKLCLPKDECAWHRLDVLRFRYHPCFQLATDQASTADSSVQLWGVENGTVLVTAPSGIAWIELFPEGEDICRTFVEYVEKNMPPSTAPRQLALTEQALRDRLPEDKRKKKFKIAIFSCGGGQHEVEDFSQLNKKEGKMKLPNGHSAYRSAKLGFSQMADSQPGQAIFAINNKNAGLMHSVKIYHGASLDGIEFFYEDNHSDLLGTRGGQPGGSDFVLDIRRSETIIGFYLRAGAWIDAIQILTSTGRRSEIYGNATGGSGHTLIPPVGYSIAGVFGTCGAWLDGFGLYITR